MKRAVIYARYSSEAQREESAEAQIAYCEEYAAQHDLIILHQYVDHAKSAKGGKAAKRTEFQRMINDSADHSFDVVLVHKYNRFARSMKDHVIYESKLNDNHVSLIAVAEDFGHGKESIIMKSLMRALSEYYIIDLADETRKGLRVNAEKAMHNGGYAPFGYDIVDQKYVINELEAGYVRKMFDCALNRTGYKDLVKEMEAAGIRGKRGKTIKYPSIYEILRNERYTGTYVYAIQTEKHNRRDKNNAIRIDNAMPAIVTHEEWEKVQKIMSERKQSGRSAANPYKGLVYCGKCGSKMYAHTSVSKRNGVEYSTYVCSKSCGVGTVAMDSIDSAVDKYIEELLNPSTQAQIVEAIKEYNGRAKSRINEFNTAVREAIAERQQQYDGYMQTLSTGGLPAEVISEIGKKMMDLKHEISILKEKQPPKDYTERKILDWLEAIKKNPTQETAHLLIERIEATKEGVNISTTLTPILRNIGGGTRI